ncbi:MAG: cell division FtsA domain-containing protein [Pseudomonadota bacterium]
MFKKKAKANESDIAQEKRVAIDIGLYSIKFAYFKDQKLCLEEFPLFEQHKDLKAIKPKELGDSQTAAINKAVSMINPKAEFILSPQPSLQVLTRVFPQSSDIDLKRLLDKELPFEPEEYGFDSHKVTTSSTDKKTKKSAQKFSALVVSAAELDFIQRSIGLLGEFQLQIKRFSPNHVALLNYLLLSSDGQEPAPTVLIDLGALYSHLIVYKSRDKFLARTIELGGNHFNLELIQKLNVDYDTAEKIKTERKLIDDSLFDSKGASTSMPMFQAINSILYRLVDEVKNSMTYFEDGFIEDLSDATILLSGGSSNLQNLNLFLERELELPVKKVEKAVYPIAAERAFAPQFASAVGLLTDPARSDLININLINNMEGLLFKLEDGDYYLTKDGFVNKKKYKKKQRSQSFKPTVKGGSASPTGEATVDLFQFLASIPERIMALIKGEKFQMREIRVSFPHLDLSPVVAHMKVIFVAAGVLFLVIYGGIQFFWAPKKRGLDSSVKSYVQKRNEVDQARGALIAAMRNAEKGDVPMTVKVAKMDKIIWAEKLKAIANAIPERVWISAMEITDKPLSLVLSCHVYSYGEDHLKDIALFIQNLKKEETFLEEIKDIVFHSAVRSKDKDVYDFKLTFPLKRSMIQKVTETVTKPKG